MIISNTSSRLILLAFSEMVGDSIPSSSGFYFRYFQRKSVDKDKSRIEDRADGVSFNSRSSIFYLRSSILDPRSSVLTASLSSRRRRPPRRGLLPVLPPPRSGCESPVQRTG